MISMIIKMSLVTILYIALTAALKLWVHTDKSELTVRKRIFIGIVYGICAILSTHFGVVYDEMALNVRDIAPLAAGLFFDPYSGIIAGLIGGTERYIAGTYFGVGEYTRIACSVSTCLAGFVAAGFNKKIFHGKKPMPLYSFLLGAVMEVFHMYVVFITHRNDMKMAFYVVSTCSIPMIIFTGIGMAGCAIVLYALSGRLKGGLHKPKDEEISISVRFQMWLLVCTMILLLTTFFFSFSVQTRSALQNAQETMEINTQDAKETYDYIQKNYESVQELIKEQALITAHAAAAEIDRRGIENMTDDELIALRDMYDVFIIEVINKDGIVIRATNKDYENYDMNSAEQSKAFMDIIDGKIDELAQDFRTTGMNENVSLMYVGVKSADGFVQIALDDEDIAKFSSLTDFEAMLGGRHVGENGGIFLADKNAVIIAGEYKGKNLADMGLQSIPEDELSYFEADFLGEKTYCRLEHFDGEHIIFTTLPMSEVFTERDANAYETAFADILLFTAVFMLIYILVQKIVVNNLDRINASLTRITNGNLDEMLNVRSSSEFASLSDDINLTVKALKGYIAQAEKRIEEELEFARQIQNSALPKMFKFPRDEFELYATMNPAKEVGGDFYDFFFVDQNKIALVIADVSGKGIPAALFMMRSKTAIKNLAEAGRNPGKIFEKANEVLCEGNDADMFVTAWIGIVDLESGIVQCANAGHEYPAIKRADGKWELFKDKHCLALAAMDGMTFKEYELKLEPGDKLFVYTDGVPEAINKDEIQFGTDRMLESLNDAQNTGMENILPFVRNRIRNFVDGADQFDDITMLGFELKHKTESKTFQKIL